MANPLPSRQQLLTTYSGFYDPVTFTNGLPNFNTRRPFRPLWDVPRMSSDPRVALCLQNIKGTLLSLARFQVVDNDRGHEEIRQFVIRQLIRWWKSSAIYQLAAIEYGYAGFEVMYKLSDGIVHFDHLLPFHPSDCRPITLDGSLTGVALKKSEAKASTYLACPKALWHVYGREYSRFWGRSLLYSAYEPWLELHSDHGAVDVRRLYYYKYSYRSDVLYHPPGSDMTTDGQMVNNKTVARQILANERSGGGVAFPSEYDEQGNLMWKFMPRQSNDAGNGILMYCDTLREEITEGLGTPKETLAAANTGSGWSGRAIPQASFHYMLHTMQCWMVHDFNEQVLVPLVRLNFGVEEPDYEIVPFGMVEDTRAQMDQLQSKELPPSAKLSLVS